MTEPEFDEIAALWNEPDPAEQQALEALAHKAGARAKLLGYADIALAVLLIGGSAVGALMTPSPIMITVALLCLLCTVWLTWKRRAIRQMSRTLQTGDRFAFLESSVRNARANLRRITLSLAFFPSFILLAATFKVALRNGGQLNDPFGSLAAWATSTRGIVSLTLMALIAAAMLRSRMKTKAELRRLEELRQAYQDEALKDEADGR